MFSKRDENSCGRAAEPPNHLKHHHVSDLAEEAMPITQQIENLRSKISLKERYNNVLKEELNESREGASSVLHDLLNETQTLRRNMMEAIDREKFAVQNALRTHRTMQLVLRSKTPDFAEAWLDDKLFDHAKQLNGLVDTLFAKRDRLQEAERVVMLMEKWPRPGSTPWEMKIMKQENLLGVAIDSMKVKLETAKLLYVKYHEIKERLRDEEEKYAPVIRNLESQLAHQKQEMRTLQNMLDDALIFESEAFSTLALTEKESLINRRKRRVQMGKIKVAVEKVLSENSATIPNGRRAGYNPLERKTISAATLQQDLASTGGVNDRLRVKRAEIEELEAWVSRLVETMRVPFNSIPLRFKTVRKVGLDLEKEKVIKEKLKHKLVRERDLLMLILRQLSYTGNQEVSDFTKVVQDYDSNLTTLKKVGNHTQRIINTCGDRIDSIRIGMSGILNRLDDQKSHQITDCDHLLKLFPVVRTKVEQLVNDVEKLESDVEHQHVHRRQSKHPMHPRASEMTVSGGGFVGATASGGIRAYRIPDRCQRVPVRTMEEGSDEEDLEDYKLPTRNDIKAKSFKILQQGLIRKGISQVVVMTHPHK